MSQYYVWVTFRRIRAGTHDEFERAWTPRDFPDGLLRADAWYGDDDEEIVGVSFWQSREACERYRASAVEEERRRAMEPYVVEERSVTYAGRELGIPH